MDLSYIPFHLPQIPTIYVLTCFFQTINSFLVYSFQFIVEQVIYSHLHLSLFFTEYIASNTISKLLLDRM